MIHSDELFFNISKGPSKFDLMVSLFDGNMNTPRNVEFHLEGARLPISVAIKMVQQEDGSGNSWNFSGYVMNGPAPFMGIMGHMSITSRQGYIKFEVPSHKALNGDEYVEVINHHDELVVLEFLSHLREKVATVRR